MRNVLWSVNGACMRGLTSAENEAGFRSTSAECRLRRDFVRITQGIPK